jgi:transcriptional regulator with XRE-family HTH domain
MSSMKAKRVPAAPASDYLNTDRVRALRLKLGLTQQQAADRAHMAGRQEWNKIETGLRPDIRISTLLKLGRALGVPPGELLR